MWAIIKYKLNEQNFLKKNFSEVLGESPYYYIPKIRYKKLVNNKIKIFEKSVLEGYLICFHTKIQDSKILFKLKYTRGLNYFLNGFRENQKEISYFVDYCKKFEDEKGCLSQDFFDSDNIKKGQFVSGPFTNLIFNIVSRQRNKLKVLIGNLKTTVSKKSGYLYRPI